MDRREQNQRSPSEERLAQFVLIVDAPGAISLVDYTE
jgi:hypothetical protein